MFTYVNHQPPHIHLSGGGSKEQVIFQPNRREFVLG